MKEAVDINVGVTDAQAAAMAQNLGFGGDKGKEVSTRNT